MFIKNCSQEMKASLIAHSLGLVYTPTNEHFGIVPLEAMALGRPVIADNTGGPRESILPGENGFLCDNWEAYGSAMIELIEKKDLSDKLGSKGSKRVEEVFSFGAFSKQLNMEIMNMKKTTQLQLYVPFVLVILVVYLLCHLLVCYLKRFGNFIKKGNGIFDDLFISMYNV